MSFYTGTQCELLYSLPSAVTKNTYTTQAILSATSTQPRPIVPAGYFGPVPNGKGRGLLMTAMGTVANTAAATLAVALCFDPTPGTIANANTIWPATAPTASVTTLWKIEAWYTCTTEGGQSGALQCNAKIEFSNVASGSATTSLIAAYTQFSMSSLNFESQNEIAIAGTWSASSASNTTTLQQMFLFGLN
jgi:hypothetical protein